MPHKACAFDIRPYDSAAGAACLDLLGATRPGSESSHRNSDFWTWKHSANPFGVSEGLCAVDPATQRLVGLRILMKWTLQAPDGTHVRAARAVDTATHPEYQRRGIFATLTRGALTELASHRVDLIFNTPNERSLPGYLQLGWRQPHHRALYFKVLKPGNFSTRLVGGRQQSDGTPSWEACFTGAIRRWDEFCAEFGDEIETLTRAWEACRRRTGVRTPRTMDYLNWRYGPSSGIPYGVLASTDDQGLRGFVVMRPNSRYGLREVLAVEIVLRRPAVSLGLRVLREARQQISADWIVAHAAPGTLEREMFLLSAFHRWPGNTIPFVSRPLNSSRLHPVRAADWDLSLGDLEIF